MSVNGLFSVVFIFFLSYFVSSAAFRTIALIQGGFFHELIHGYLDRMVVNEAKPRLYNWFLLRVSFFKSIIQYDLNEQEDCPDM